MRRLKRMAALGVVVGVELVGGAGAAGGQEPGVEPTPLPGDVAAAIVEDGWYADPESVGDREQLDQVAERLANQGEPMGFALLAEEPPGSSPAYAEDVLDALMATQPGQRVRTVVVLSDADVGVVSDFWSDQAIDDALDETIDDLRADPTDGLEALADALAAAPSGFDEDGGSDTSDDDSGPNTGLIALGVVALGGIAIASRYWSSPTDGDGYDDSSSYDSGASSRARRRRRSSFSRSRSSRSSGGGSSRRSSGGSSRGRGGRRL